MTLGAAPRSVDRSPWTMAVAALVLVFGLTYGCLSTRREIGQFAVIWPANAVVTAMLLKSPRRWWLGMLSGGLIGNLAAKIVIGNHLAPTLVLPLANSLEIFLSAAVTQRLVGLQVDLSKPRHLGAFVVSAGGVAPFISAFLAAAILSLWQGDNLWADLFDWWSTDALGLLIVTPAVLMLTPSGLGDLRRALRGGRGILSVAALGISLALVFGQTRYPVVFLIPAALIFVAFELGIAGAALALLITCVLATVLILIGPPVAGLSVASVRDTALVLQAFLATMSVLVLPVAAALASRARLEDDLRVKQGEMELALDQLKDSEARYRLLTDRTLDVIIRYDAEGVLEYVSPSVHQFGFRPEDLIGRRTRELVHPEDVGALTHRGQDVVAGPEALTSSGNVFRVRRSNGDLAWIEGNPAPMLDEAGKIIGGVSVLRDITERRALAEALQRRTLEAETASVAKSEFLANMSHEIRTPLTAIIGFAGLLKDDPDRSGPQATYVERIVVAGQALLGVVNDILDFSKLEARQIELDPRPFAPVRFVEETVELVRHQAQLKGLSLDVRTEGAFPDAVSADSGRLRQILLNLLTNAIKFTQNGGVSITAHYLLAPGALKIEVTDTGAGIAADKMDRLFQRFSQVDGSSTRDHGGTGLGLAISKALAELMGGSVGVDSQAGRGSTFWVTVAAPAAEIAPAGATRRAPGADRPVRILVVDDVANNRELVRALLSPFGHDLSEAAGGAEAMDLAARQPFDLILMDLQMPGVDGLTAARAVRAGDGPNRATPILALSANVLPTHLEACDAAGMQDHIAKPIDPADLLLKVYLWAEQDEEAERSEAAS